MNFYTRQHEFYCGIDLHSNKMYACVVDGKGAKRLHRNFKTSQPDLFLSCLRPFHDHDLVIGCESTFNWYWLAELCVQEEIPFILGHALYLKAIHGGKTKNDKIDSEKLAMLLRGGNFPTSYVYPKEMRSTRDLMRRRTFLVRRRAEALGHIKLLILQHNLPPLSRDMRYRSNRESVIEHFSDPSDRLSIQTDLDLVEQCNQLIHRMEKFLMQNAKIQDPQSFYRLQSIPGVGPILALTMLYELHDINRFRSVGNFLSYSRLVRGEHTSNGKRYASGGNKIGNPYLKWAFSEAVPGMKRCCSEAAAFLRDIEKKHNKARANSQLAVKLGRAVYYMLKRKEGFDVNCFGK